MQAQVDTLANENLKIQVISNLLSKWRIDEAIKKLGDLQLQNDHRKQLILISGKWHSFQYKRQIGTIQKADEERITATISESLVNLLDNISSDFPGISIYNPKRKFWRRMGPLYVVGSASLVIGITALMLIIPWTKGNSVPNSLAVKVKAADPLSNFAHQPMGEVEIICNNDTFLRATNSSGQAKFEGLPDSFFNSGRSIAIRYRDQENQFLLAEKPDSAYKVRKEELIELNLGFFKPDFSGLVIDSATNKPVVGAEVRMGNTIAITDQLGAFWIAADSIHLASEEMVRIQKKGYYAFEQDIALNSEDGQLFELKALPSPEVVSKEANSNSASTQRSASPPQAKGLIESLAKSPSKSIKEEMSMAKKCKQPSDEYYISIGGINYDRKIVELADSLVAGRGDGRISMADAKKLLPLFEDEGNITQVEEMTLLYILENYKWTDAAKRWLKTQINDTSKPSSPATLGPLRVPKD